MKKPIFTPALTKEQLIDANMNGAMIIARTKDAIYVRIPKLIQSGIGPCSCGACDGKGHWDTLVIPIAAPKSGNDYCTAVHLPNARVQQFVEYCAKPKAKA